MKFVKTFIIGKPHYGIITIKSTMITEKYIIVMFVEKFLTLTSADYSQDAASFPDFGKLEVVSKA